MTYYSLSTVKKVNNISQHSLFLNPNKLIVYNSSFIFFFSLFPYKEISQSVCVKFSDLFYKLEATPQQDGMKMNVYNM